MPDVTTDVSVKSAATVIAGVTATGPGALPSTTQSKSSAKAPTKVAAEEEIKVVVLRSLEELQQHRAEWEDLCKNSIEPNPFYEPWMFIPSVQHFGYSRQLYYVLVYHISAKPQVPSSLIGFFPFHKCAPYGRWPIWELRLWKTDYTYVCTPPLREKHAQAAINAVLNWAQQAKLGVLVDFPHVAGDGPFHQALIDVVFDRDALRYDIHCYNRALLHSAADAETYLNSSMTCHSRQELRRQKRRLSEQGTLETRVLESDGNLEWWIEEFLQMEAKSWKGQEGSSLLQDETKGDYFRTIARAAFAREKLLMLGLFLDGRPIALKCNFLCGTGAFAFKIAFDESVSKFSPGVQLELANTEVVHERKIAWMDSCAIPGNFMIRRLWKDQRTIVRVLMSTCRRGDFILGMMSLGRAFRKLLGRTLRPSKK